MEQSDDKNFDLESHIDKCRCCFRTLKDQEYSDITKTIEKKFFALTQIQLIQNDDYSTKICSFCENDLDVFVNFRTNLIEKQKKLYFYRSKRVRESELGVSDSCDDNNVPKISIKTELEESVENIFVDCTALLSSEVKQEFEETPVDVKPKTGKRKKSDISTDEEHHIFFRDFKKTLKQNKNKYIECPRCFKSLHRDSIKEHINVVHYNQNKFDCKICDYKASRYGRIMQHMKAIHKQQIDPKYEKSSTLKRQCSYCGALIRNWRRHILKVHMNVKNFFCDCCKYSSFFKYDMEQHMKVHVKKLPKEPQKYFCDVCGLEFDKRFHLNSHVKAKHTLKERIHQCEVCEKSFFSSENLKKHAESHGSRTMPCEFCGKLFTCMNNLRTHLYYHSDPKFICDFPNCDKKFFMRKRLRAHLKTHNGQKDFACQFCEKSYFSQNDLNRHLFSIHEKLRFFCQVPGCHGNFSRREYYKKHALAHHQNLGQDALDQLLLTIKDAQPCQKF